MSSRSRAGAAEVVRRAAVLACAAAGVLLTGCLEKPSIEDRWTRIDLLSSNMSPNQALVPGTLDSIAVQTAITYRAIVTGYAVAELRASASIAPNTVTLDPNAPRQVMAGDIDRILQNSVSVGREARAITGWDHLIQHLDFSFRAVAPAAMDTSGAPAGLFLLCYLGSGERVERRDGSDTIIVTPFPSGEYQILPIGMKLSLAGPVAR